MSGAGHALDAGCSPASGRDGRRLRVLVADDREDVRLALLLLLRGAGHCGAEAASPREVEGILAREACDLVLLDLNYARDTTSGAEGLALLRRLRRTHPRLPVVVMTAWGSIELAVEAMREGARDFVLKPWDDAALVVTLERHGRSAGDGTWDPDLRLAGRVQARFRRLEAPPTLGAVEYAGACTEAGAVGGDAWDVLDLGPGRLGLFVADAVGKGVSGALLMAYLQASLRSLSRHALHDLPGLVARVNRVFHGATAPEHYATLFLGVLDERLRLRYVNCAHPAPVLLREDGRVEHLRPNAFAFGLFEDARPEEAEIALAPGDVLLALTDGVLEARREDEEYGETRVVESLARARHRPVAEIPDRLLDEVFAFAAEGEADDRTVLVLRIREA